MDTFTEGKKLDLFAEYLQKTYELSKVENEYAIPDDDPEVLKILLEYPSKEAEQFITRGCREAIKNSKSDSILERTKLWEVVKKYKIKFKDYINVSMHDIIAEQHEGKKIQFNCVINGLGEEKTYYYKAVFTCPQCKIPTEVSHDDLYETEIPKCPEGHGDMKLEKADSITKSIMKVMLEEPMEESIEAQPKRYAGIITDELVHQVKAMKRKKVIAIFKSVPVDGKKLKQNYILLDIQSWQDMEENIDELPDLTQIEWIRQQLALPDGLSKVVNSFSNKVGLYDIKLSMMIALVRGCRIKDVVERDDIHVFNLGDPATSKSELLKFCHEITSNSIIATGDSANKVGIRGGTETLPDGSHVFVPGLLTKATGGFLLYDEMDKTPKEDFPSLYRGMEQQEISYDKIIHAKLPADTTVIATANPKHGYYDKAMTFQQNFNIPPALQTRFDLVWFIPSVESEDVIRKIAGQATDPNYKWEPFMDKKLMSQYLNYCRKLQPKFTEEAGSIINEFWIKAKSVSMKQQDGIKIEVRHLHGLIRIAFAFAKLQLHETVTKQDAEYSIALFTRSLKSIGQDVVTGETTQRILFGRKENRDHAFMEVINRIADPETGIIEPEQAKEELVKTGVFDVYTAQERLEKEARKGDTIINTYDNRYKISK